MNDKPETGELSADELDQLATETRRRHARAIWDDTAEAFDDVRLALKKLPYVQAMPALARLDEIQDVIADPLGEHMGSCILCEEPMFIRGEPDDDYESAGDEACHRSCGDKWRREHPGEGRGYRDDEGDD